MSQYVMELDKNTFDKIKDEALCIVDFWANWCMPCKMLSPIYMQVAQSYSDKMSFYKVDIDSNEELATANNVESIPTLIVFKNGVEVDRIMGYRSKDSLIADIKKYIKE